MGTVGGPSPSHRYLTSQEARVRSSDAVGLQSNVVSIEQALHRQVGRGSDERRVVTIRWSGLRCAGLPLALEIKGRPLSKLCLLYKMFLQMRTSY
jgi:hypothetical protein